MNGASIRPFALLRPGSRQKVGDVTVCSPTTSDRCRRGDVPNTKQVSSLATKKQPRYSGEDGTLGRRRASDVRDDRRGRVPRAGDSAARARKTRPSVDAGNGLRPYRPP